MSRKKKMPWGVWVAMWTSILAAVSASHSETPVAGGTEAVELHAGADTLYGTLVVPAAKKPVPLVMIISGSGPTDRNGNTAMLPGKNNCLKMLADSLRSHGIASLRYDKRGVGASVGAAKAEQDLRVTTYSEDAALWAQQYRNDPRFKTLVLLGHSEGALIGTLAADHSHADALVLVSGAGRPAREIIHEQLARAVSGEMQRKSDAIMDTLLMGREVIDVPATLMALYRPSVQPYMRSWLAVDPAGQLKAANVPAMVVWGTSDVQISKADAELLAEARKGIKKLIVPNMNHVLKATPSDAMVQISSYSDSTLSLAPGLVDPIASFVRGIKRSS